MKRFPRLLVALALLLPIQARSQQEETYDYWRFQPQHDRVRPAGDPDVQRAVHVRPHPRASLRGGACLPPAAGRNPARGQCAIVVPSHDLVIVRRGLDYGRQGFSHWDLTREVSKAVRVATHNWCSRGSCGDVFTAESVEIAEIVLELVTQLFLISAVSALK